MGCFASFVFLYLSFVVSQRAFLSPPFGTLLSFLGVSCCSYAFSSFFVPACPLLSHSRTSNLTSFPHVPPLRHSRTIPLRHSRMSNLPSFPHVPLLRHSRMSLAGISSFRHSCTFPFVIPARIKQESPFIRHARNR